MKDSSVKNQVSDWDLWLSTDSKSNVSWMVDDGEWKVRIYYSNGNPKLFFKYEYQIVWSQKQKVNLKSYCFFNRTMKLYCICIYGYLENWVSKYLNLEFDNIIHTTNSSKLTMFYTYILWSRYLVYGI